MGAIQEIEKAYLRTDLPTLETGDKVLVKVRIKEGDKERVQPFEGTIIKIHATGLKGTFTVRKISYGVGVERIFPLHSPALESVAVLSKGKTRRSKLYYLRGRKGKSARLKEQM